MYLLFILLHSSSVRLALRLGNIKKERINQVPFKESREMIKLLTRWPSRSPKLKENPSFHEFRLQVILEGLMDFTSTTKITANAKHARMNRCQFRDFGCTTRAQIVRAPCTTRAQLVQVGFLQGSIESCCAWRLSPLHTLRLHQYQLELTHERDELSLTSPNAVVL